MGVKGVSMRLTYSVGGAKGDRQAWAGAVWVGMVGKTKTNRAKAC
jgi:hypothetical protein